MNAQNAPWQEGKVQATKPTVPQSSRSQSLNVALVIGPGFSQISLAAICDVFTTGNQVSSSVNIELQRVSITDARSLLLPAK